MSRPRFNPRGNFPLPRPRAPNPPGMRPPGPFMRPGPMGLPRFYPAGRARGVPHRFAGPESYPNLGPQRMNVQVTQHRTDPRLTKEKLEFHEAQQKKGKPHGSRWDDEPQLAAPGAVKPSSVAQGAEPSAKVQSRYTKESASSILASFGLSNEDLEELSRYPDEQLTPENMPLILRDIRMRKMGRRLPNLPSHGRTKEALGSESVSSNVIDYGHASKYGYTEDPLEVRIYDPEIPTDDVKNEFQSPQNISAPVPAPHVMCSSMFPVEDVFRQMDFPGESASQSFFPVESGTKMSGLHISGQSVLEPVKPISQSVSQTVSQTVSPSLIPPSINQPFSSQLISALSQQIPHKPVINSANVPDGPRGSKKSYQPEADMPIQSPFGIVRASWLPKFSHMDAQSMKRLPTPSMMNDYYAASPRIFPHLCSLCNVECSHLKDWIQHQNTSTHIESCRQLRQQYPDWNPEILPSRRSESIRKEDEAPRRRSHSPSPRRSRRSSSSHRLRRSRTPVRYAYRPRSRSPRICHRFISRYRYRCRSRSRSRSRSPYRRRLPFRGSPRYHRSLSPERTPRRSVRSSDRKKSLEDEQRSAHGAEASKLKYPDAAEKGLSPAQKPRTSSGAKPPAKPTSCAKSDASSGHAVRKSKSLEADPAPEGRHGTGKALSLQRKSRKDQSLSSNSILLISELPEDGCTEEDIRKVFQPFGKVNDVLIVPGRNEAYLEMEFKKAVAAIMKYNEATPLLVRGKGVKISVPGKRRSQNKEMKKKIPDSKKSSASALKKEANAAKTVETVTSTSTTKSVKKSLEARKAVYIKNKDSSKPTILSANSEPKTSVAATKRGAEETVSEDTLEATEKEPLSKEQEEMCVVLISNLPNKGYSTEEIYNLVKPFGGLKDILILSSHNKAYIEINRKSADSMVKFYTCFPICMDGNQLSLSLAPENMDITDEVALFTALIQESDPEANIDQIRSQFVHLDNLPEDGLQCVLCVGHQFGKVSHHVFMRNKNKAILQLESPESAQSMYSFLKQNPQSIGDHVLTCTLSPEMDSDAQTEKDPELGKQSPDLKKSPVDESEVQTAADSPSVNPSEVEEESAHNTQTAASVQQEELCGKEPVEALRDSDCVVEMLGIETQGAEASTEIPLAASTAARPELLPDNTEGSALNQQVRARDFQKEEAEAVTPAAEAAVSGGVCTEARSIQGAVEEAPSQTEDLFSGVTEPVVEAAAEGEKPEVVSEVAPPACVVPQGPSVCVEDEEVESKKGISEESHVDAREESERHSKGSPEDCQVETEKAEKTEASVAAERPEKLLAGREKPPEQAAVKTSTDKGAGHPSQPEESEHASLPTVAHGWSSKPSVKAAVVSSKAKVAASKTENQKISLKSLLRDQKNAEKKLSAKEFGPLKSTRSGLAESSCKAKPTVSGASRRGSGRLSALQCKDAKPLDHKDVAKQSQETEPRPSTAKRDGGSNKAMAGQNTKNSKSTTGRSSKSKEEPLFTFDLDEFVTVDEVIEEVNLSQAEQTPLKGRRKELNSELNFKKKKGRTSVPHGAERELPFVTLDEVGEEEDAAAQALVTVDEVIDEEDLNVEEMVKNSNSLLTLDELIDHDESVSHGDPKDVTVLSVAEEQALLKQERLVTVDQIGEVEELPLGEPADMAFAALNAQAGGNASRGSIRFISSQLPEDPSALVTVDEIRDDSSDLHLVTLDEVTEEDGDSLADFNDLKEELDFVTVDEVGEEEDADNDSKAESALGRIARHTDKKGDRKRRALGPKKTKLELSQAGPAGETATQEDLKTMVEKHLAAKPPLKRLRIGKASASQKTVSAEAVKGSEALQMSREADEDVGSKDSEPDEKRRKMEDTGSSTSAAPDSPGDLDFLVPKAGFFCPICSLFYSGEKAMSNHCKSARHKENMERFMAKQRKEKEQSETEERSSR